MQHARFRFLSQARSVLNVDIDELVLSDRNRSIFAATEQARGGFVKFSGRWVSATTPHGVSPGCGRHGDFWLLDAQDKIKQEEERIAETLRGVETPVLILLNKIDLVSKGKLLPLMERCAQLLPGKEIVPVSAIRGEGKLSEEHIQEALKEIRMALLEADVNFRVVKQLVDSIRTQALGHEVMTSLTPAQQVVKIVRDELVEMLGGRSTGLRYGAQPPTVILMAATNRPDILDPALLRPGRFDRHITVDRPDLEGRKGILKVHARGKPFDESVDLSTIARRTPGFTGADLSNVINEAALLAARWGKKAITMKEVEEAIDRVMAGPERKTRVMSEREKRVIAYHEGGHALVAHVLPNTDPVHKISVIPRGRALGYTLTLPEEDKFLMTREELADELAMLLGGRVAEELIVGDITTGAANDIVIVTDDDVDVTNLEHLIWAVAMRTDPKHSIQFIDGSWDSPADPALSPEKRAAGDLTHSVAIINACKPYHWRDQFPPSNTPSPELTRKAKEKFGWLLGGK